MPTSDLVAAEPGRNIDFYHCNCCGYAFVRKGEGLDMGDFKAHKDKCLLTYWAEPAPEEQL